jgi:hypothetical protein
MKNQTRIERKRRTVGKRLQPRGELSQLGAIFLCDLYDTLDEKPFRDAMADFEGLAELLVENNTPEARAIKTMVQAENELNRIRDKVHNF